MSIYFEPVINTSIDHLLSLIPFLVVLFLVIKFPVITQVASDITKTKRTTLVGAFVAICLLAISAEISQYHEKVEVRNIIENKEFQQVQGCISNYESRKPKAGTLIESFSIEGVEFYFSNHDAGPYFHGGLHNDNFFKNGRCVSIDYILDGNKNKILKIVKLTTA
ncbi:hypothetical protein [Pseudoalteromonas luteoviolacea]|uniref:Uncharacterized protein n=1 Tax=Pseudoalteromonas luteoviolacea (strain 2ta16) TaxID=1353533 RepID=V4HKZ9_PSEL2|nr:hypothetical protein [Pseudoalteromonas luteoviolacea]ESP91495.1 hypothetical protein PL2TA16_00294 [Pseudoalteromonas luteoviolacea 2ta16]KZN40146.1 hypothetical protein N483_18325 [Pseudoalteromonas luteoviolacea NCIMB 1944]